MEYVYRTIETKQDIVALMEEKIHKTEVKALIVECHSENAIISCQQEMTELNNYLKDSEVFTCIYVDTSLTFNVLTLAHNFDFMIFNKNNDVQLTVGELLQYKADDMIPFNKRNYKKLLEQDSAKLVTLEELLKIGAINYVVDGAETTCKECIETLLNPRSVKQLSVIKQYTKYVRKNEHECKQIAEHEMAAFCTLVKEVQNG